MEIFIIKFFRFLCFLFITLAFFPLKTVSMSLEECIAQVLKQHPTLKKSQYALKQAKENINQKKASFYPEIALSTQYSQQYNETSQKRSENYGLSLSVNELLFNGLQRYYAYQQSLLSNNLAQEDFKKTRFDLIFLVKELAYSLNLYKKQVEVLKKVITRRQEDLVIIKLKYNGGKESLVSVQEMEADVLDAQVSLLEKEEQINLITEILNLMREKPANEPLTITLASLPQENSQGSAFIQQALTNSYQAKRLEILLDMQECNIKSIQGEYFPRISLYGGVGLSENQFFPSKKNWNFGLSLNLQLFSGFLTQAKKQEAHYKKLELKEEQKALEIQLKTDIKKILTALKILQEKIIVWQQKYQAALNSYELTRLSYQQGKLSYQWLKQKESELFNLELSKESLLYEMRVKNAEIEKITQGEEIAEK